MIGFYYMQSIEYNSQVKLAMKYEVSGVDIVWTTTGCQRGLQGHYFLL